MPIDLNEDLQPVPMSLGQCPCGAEAVWYRADSGAPSRGDCSETDVATPTFGVRFMRAADLTENLCEECFADAVAPVDHPLWRRAL